MLRKKKKAAFHRIMIGILFCFLSNQISCGYEQQYNNPFIGHGPSSSRILPIKFPTYFLKPNASLNKPNSPFFITPKTGLMILVTLTLLVAIYRSWNYYKTIPIEPVPTSDQAITQKKTSLKESMGNYIMQLPIIRQLLTFIGKYSGMKFLPD